MPFAERTRFIGKLHETLFGGVFEDLRTELDLRLAVAKQLPGLRGHQRGKFSGVGTQPCGNGSKKRGAWRVARGAGRRKPEELPDIVGRRSALCANHRPEHHSPLHFID